MNRSKTDWTGSVWFGSVFSVFGTLLWSAPSIMSTLLIGMNLSNYIASSAGTILSMDPCTQDSVDNIMNIAINQIENKLHRYMSWQLIRVFNNFIKWSVWKPCHFHILCVVFALAKFKLIRVWLLWIMCPKLMLYIIQEIYIYICMAWIVSYFWWVLKLQCISGSWWMFARWWVIRNLIIENVI